MKKSVFGLRYFIFMIVFMVYNCSGSGEYSMQRDIAVNQAGYLPDEPKVATVAFSSLSEDADSFLVVRTGSMKPVYKNELRIGAKQDLSTGDTVYLLEFTEVDDPGSYRLLIPGLSMQSEDFYIGTEVYNTATRVSLESFYYQRCGIEVGMKSTWSHSTCHMEDAVFYNDTESSKNVAGGWHDAGDYGKYSVNTSVSLAFLLYLFEHQPHKFSDGDLEIPEAGNGLPDLLDEARWALDWLMKMQGEDGGVFHKVQKEKWTGEYLPHEDPDQRYIYEISSTSTAGFAAVTALGARLYRNLDSQFSSSLEESAQSAWNFLVQHPGIIPEDGFKNPSGVHGGEYGDQSDSDERLWAAVELYRLTGDTKFHDYILANYREAVDLQVTPLSWKEVDGFFWTSYLRMQDSRQNQDVRKYLMDKLLLQSDTLIHRASQSGYRVALQKDEYYWGSNSVALGYAFILVQAFEMTDEKRYKTTALDQLHYILGRNSFGLSFVTGTGSRSVTQPYHQFSNELNTVRPVPGLVVGGPNSFNQLDGQPLSEYPGRAYEDNKRNYMVNEVAINYTAPFVYLAGYFSQPEDNKATISSN